MSLPSKEAVFESKVSNALSNRIDRILLVIECCTDNKNYIACLRTCDILGIQNVWIIEAPLPAQEHNKCRIDANIDITEDSVQACKPDKRQPVEQGRKKGRIARASSQWLDIQQFSSSTAAIKQLKASGWTIWATDLHPGAVSLAELGHQLQLPHRLAIVLGNESRGVSDEMRAAADRCVYLPMSGFTESLNVSVATALVLQTLIAADPSVRGDLLGECRAAQLEAKWRAAAERSGIDGRGLGGHQQRQQQQPQQPQQQAQEQRQQQDLSSC